MTPWYFYFLGKLLLHAQGRLSLNVLLNALLLGGVLAPAPASLGPRGARRWKHARAVAAWILAAALAWSESWLSPPMTILQFIIDPSLRPSFGYVLSFLAGAVDWRLLTGAAALAGAIFWSSRRGYALTPLVILGLVSVAIGDRSTRGLGGSGHGLGEFRTAEAVRGVRFPAAAGTDFDVIIIHVCSLSWEDARVAGMSDDPFWRGFHAVFMRFNSATSYSNPAALRLLRAPCGQSDHAALFAPAGDDCYWLDALRHRGYASWAASNHDGDYDHYAAVLQADAHADAPLALDGVPAPKLNFNGSRVYDDGAVLERWWRARQRSGAKRAVLYYNTVSLHQGVHAPGQPGDWFKDRVLHYHNAARDFFEEMQRFFALIEGSRRRAVVFFVAEHGAALEGSSIQAPDLRDIPLPSLTMVPVAVRLLGPGAPPTSRAASSRPTSYLALAELLRRFLERPPFAKDAPPLDVYLQGLPETAFVAENESSLVLEERGRYLARDNRGRWKHLPSDAARDKTP